MSRRGRERVFSVFHVLEGKQLDRQDASQLNGDIVRAVGVCFISSSPALCSLAEPVMKLSSEDARW